MPAVSNTAKTPYEALELVSEKVKTPYEVILANAAKTPYEALKKLSSHFGIPYEVIGQVRMVEPGYLTDCLVYPYQLRTGMVHVIPRRENSSYMGSSGEMFKSQYWFNSQHLISVDYDVVDLDFLTALRFFYDCVEGDLSLFYFQDWTNPNPIGEFCGVGDGINTEFKIRGDVAELITVYTAAPPSFNRVRVTPVSIDYTTGKFIIAAPAPGVHVIADVIGEVFKVFFQGYTVKHTTGGGFVPMGVSHLGGKAFKVTVSLLQQKDEP